MKTQHKVMAIIVLIGVLAEIIGWTFLAVVIINLIVR